MPSRSSWNKRRGKVSNSTVDVSRYTEVELLNGIRGLSVIIRDIVHAPEESADDDSNLLYVADRLDYLLVAYEERVRSRSQSMGAHRSGQKPKRTVTRRSQEKDE